MLLWVSLNCRFFCQNLNLQGFLFNSSNSCFSGLKKIFLAQTVKLIVFPSSEGQILGADDFYVCKTIFDKIRLFSQDFFSCFFLRNGPITLKLSKRVESGPQMCPNLLSFFFGFDFSASRKCATTTCFCGVATVWRNFFCWAANINKSSVLDDPKQGKNWQCDVTVSIPSSKL